MYACVSSERFFIIIMKVQLTVYGQVNPRSVVTGVVAGGCVVEEHDRTLVPALVRRPQVQYLYRRLLDETDAALIAAVDVRGVAVELHENGHLHAQRI